MQTNAMMPDAGMNNAHLPDDAKQSKSHGNLHLEWHLECSKHGSGASGIQLTTMFRNMSTERADAKRKNT